MSLMTQIMRLCFKNLVKQELKAKNEALLLFTELKRSEAAVMSWISCVSGFRGIVLLFQLSDVFFAFLSED